MEFDPPVREIEMAALPTVSTPSSATHVNWPSSPSRATRTGAGMLLGWVPASFSAPRLIYRHTS